MVQEDNYEIGDYIDILQHLTKVVHDSPCLSFIDKKLIFQTMINIGDNNLIMLEAKENRLFGKRGK